MRRVRSLSTSRSTCTALTPAVACRRRPTIATFPTIGRRDSGEMDAGGAAHPLPGCTLILGDVAETLRTFVGAYDPAPVGAVMHDMDLYSSTAQGLALFDAERPTGSAHLHRYSRRHHRRRERAVQRVHGRAPGHSGVQPVPSASEDLPRRPSGVAWPGRIGITKIYVVHDFAHARYGDCREPTPTATAGCADPPSVYDPRLRSPSGTGSSTMSQFGTHDSIAGSGSRPASARWPATARRREPRDRARPPPFCR